MITEEPRFRVCGPDYDAILVDGAYFYALVHQNVRLAERIDALDEEAEARAERSRNAAFWAICLAGCCAALLVLLVWAVCQ